MKLRGLSLVLVMLILLAPTERSRAQEPGERASAYREFRRMTDDATVSYSVKVFDGAESAMTYYLAVHDRIPEDNPNLVEVSFPSPEDGISVAMYLRHSNPSVQPRMDRIEVTIVHEIFAFTVSVSAAPDVILELSVELADQVFFPSQQMYEGAMGGDPASLLPVLGNLPAGFALSSQS